jgi:Ca2+-binding RTX toxin-like protein
MMAIDPSGHPGRSGRVATVWILAIVAMWSVQAPATAKAAVVSLDPDNPLGLLVRDGVGETNVMTVRAEAGTPDVLVFEDTGATTTTTAPQCLAVPGQVRCDSSGLIGLNVQLGDGNDVFRLDESSRTLATIVFTLISGEGGNDQLESAGGNDFLFGGPGNDRLMGGPGNDNLLGGAGEDTEFGGSGLDRLVGDAGNDHLFGEDGEDQVEGGLDDDVVDGGLGDDVVWGGAGADAVLGGEGDDRLDDTADASDAALGSDTVNGERGNDTLTGGPESDPLSPDVFIGGDGNDTITYALRRSPVVITLDGTADDGAQGEGDNVQPDLERLVGGAGGDTLVGSAGANVFDGGPGDDTLSGLAGPDTLDGGANDPGNDRLLGGDGSDVLTGGSGDDFVDGGDDGDELFGGGGTDTLMGGSGQDVLAGGPGGDSLHGGDGIDTLRGGDVVDVGADGDDKLYGEGGNDVLHGGPGDDLVDGGLGADDMHGEDGRDTASYEGRTTRIAVAFDGKANDGQRGERDNVASDVEDVLGGLLADTLTGDARDNALDAGLGDDYIIGAGGRDALIGGRGIDVLRARDGVRDVVSCGPGLDLAIVDRYDEVRPDCDNVDRGRRRPPPFRRSAWARSMRGMLMLRLPNASRFVALPGSVEFPLGSTVSARASAVRVGTTQTRRGTVQQGSFRGGPFVVLQGRGARPVTQVRLIGGDVTVCRASGRDRKKVRARLRAHVEKKRRGKKNPPVKLKVVGDYSDGAAEGTTWVTEDRCDGTLTRVMEGAVRVRDRTRHRTVVVRAGDTYLAPAPRR